MSERAATADDTDRLFQLLRQEGDPTARERLAERHLPLAEYLARRFKDRGEPLDDLIQVASLGLLKAIDRFDPDRGVAFSTFATPTIVGELKRHFRDKGWTIKVPRQMQELGRKIPDAVEELGHSLNRPPSIDEIAEHLGASVEDVIEASRARDAYTPTSLDAPVIEGEASEVIDLVGTEDEALEFIDSWEQVGNLLTDLPFRERKIIYLRFVESKSQSEIAKEIGISQMHVSRLLGRTLAELRRRAEQEGGQI